MKYFTITHPLIKYEIGVEEVYRLYLHEETIPKTLDKLKAEIKQDGFIKHPVIIDKATNVVIDGMHRVAAIKDLGYHFIPACMVEYRNPNILLCSWYRILAHPMYMHQEAVKVVREAGFTLEECEADEAEQLVNKRKAIAAFVSTSSAAVIKDSSNGIKDVYDKIKEIEALLKSHSFTISYETEHDAWEKMNSNQATAMLITPRVLKSEVVSMALAGTVFAPKTTRHIIPARTLFINIPLSWLSSELNIEEANKKLLQHLSNRRLQRLPKGQILDRKYEEELYIFKDI